MSTDDRTLQNYIEAILRLQREQSTFTDDELRQIALETGMTEEDLALARKRASDHLERGKGFLRYDNHGAAVEELEQAVVLAPTSVETLTTLAVAYWRRGESSDDRDRARSFAERALEIDPRHDDALRLISSIDKGESATAAAAPTSGGLPPRRKGTPLVAVMASLAMLGVGLSVVLFNAGGDETGEPSPSTAPVASTPALSESPQPESPVAAAPETPVPVEPRGFAALAGTFGEKGIGAGMMEDARAIAVAPDGRIFVGEYSDGRIQSFDADGKFLTVWSIGKNSYLKSISAGRDGTLYLVYRGAIHRFDAEGKDLGTLRYSGGPGFEHASTTADGGVIASWNGHYKGGLLINPQSRDAIVRFDRNGKVVRTMKTAVSAQTENFETGVDVVEDGLGNIYALSESSGAVLKFNPSGRFMNRFGGSSEPGGHRPEAIAVDGQGRVLVLDGRAIRRYDGDGRPLDELALESYGSDFALGNGGEIVTVARTKIERYR
jgi:streptogramin lyase